MKVAVVAQGLISSMGLSAEELWQNMMLDKRGLREASLFVKDAPQMPVGEIALSNEELSKLLDLSYDATMPRSTLLALYAISQALKGFTKEELAETVLISSATVGGMDISEQHYGKYLEGKQEDLSVFQRHSLGNCSKFLQSYFGLSPRTMTLSTACSSSANAIMLGSRMLQQGLAKRVVVGGTDALARFTMNGFSSLQILSSSYCRPFDEDRNGINLGEGSAYLVLEAEGYSPRQAIAYVEAYANSSDAHHQTALSPEGVGPCLAMTKALEKAKLSPKNISYINAHGTATQGNDATELKAIDEVWANDEVLFSSTKGYTGHTLAASGVIEAIISIWTINKGIAPKSIGINKAIKTDKHCPLLEHKSIDARYVMSNSFGFGGNCTSLIFGAVNKA